MSGQSSRPAPQVQHSFDGEVSILNATFDRRMELRNILQALSDELSKTHRAPTEIVADIKFRISGPQAKQHIYTVSISDVAFDAQDFARQVPNLNESVSNASLSSKRQHDSTSLQTNGQQSTPKQSTLAQSSAEPGSRDHGDDEEVVEIRPFKKPRTEPSASTPSRDKDLDAASKGMRSTWQVEDSGKIDELLTVIKDWRTEWLKQGGWLYDSISKLLNTSTDAGKGLETKLDAVQDILGESMNSAAASILLELGNISKTLPWLENCRRINAEKVQAREEKWRSSSATFHDQTRREREAAEKRIESKLADQRELLMSIARASGIDVREPDVGDADSPERSREASLGAQLTRELNMEAAKSAAAAESRSDAEHETISIIDDD